MNETVTRMLAKYDIQTPDDAYNVLREIVQEIALYGLWSGGFFKETAFYGGTALRILYGLDRYSEDMDFTLLASDGEFSFEPYRNKLLESLETMGFSVEFSPRKRPSRGKIWSAFLKGNTLNHLLSIGIPRNLIGSREPREKVNIKLEVDIDPAGQFDTEFLPALNPIPYTVRLLTPKCLFAGKMHALLFRAWGERVKGRDWYDMVWYLQRNIAVYLPYLEAKMRQSGHWTQERNLEKEDVLSIYREKASSLDMEKAIEDVLDFVKDSKNIEQTWSNHFFLSLDRLFVFEK